MKKLLILFILILVLLAGCVNAIPVVPSGTAALPGASVPALLPQVSARQIKYTNDYIDVNILVPEISGMRDTALQDSVNEQAYTEMERWAADNEQAAKEDAMAPGHYYMYSGFIVYRNDGDFLSICERVEFYSGGANVGNEIIVFNLKNSEPGVWMQLEDLFVPGTDYISEINEEINALIAADPNGGEYEFDTVNNDTRFYITDKELVIAFPPYRIASGANGEIDFAIPLINFGDMLIPELRQAA